MEKKSINIVPKNDVALLSRNPSNARIIAAANTMFLQTRVLSITLYIVAWIPLIASFTFQFISNLGQYTYVCSLISLFISVLTQVLSTSMNSHKERAVLVTQLYEANITSTTLARIEYDRESTNEANEYALRKGNRFNMSKFKSYYQVPLSLSNKYCYLYTQRIKVTEDRYLIGKNRIFMGTMMFLVGIGLSVLIVLLNTIFKSEDYDSVANILPLLVSLYPVLVPLITSFTESSASNKRAIKIAADIDNFFADHDKTSARLERFNYYIQALMYEYRVKLKPIPIIVKKLSSKKLRTVRIGCSERFVQATLDLEGNQNFGKMLNGSFNKVFFKTIESSDETGSKKASEAEVIDLILQKNSAAALKKELHIDNTKHKTSSKQVDNKKIDSKKTNTKTTEIKKSSTKKQVKTTKPKEQVNSNKKVVSKKDTTKKTKK